MHGAAGVRAMTMQTSMQAPSGRVRRVRALQGARVIGVNHQHVGGLDPAEMHLVRVHQEPGAIVVNSEREVVGHAFVHVQTRGPAKGGGKVDTLLPVVDVWVGQGVLNP